MKKLRAYLEKTRLEKPIRVKGGEVKIKREGKAKRYARFAKEVGVTLHSVRKWVNGDRRIRDATKLKIVEATEGKISLRDLTVRE